MDNKQPVDFEVVSNKPIRVIVDLPEGRYEMIAMCNVVGATRVTDQEEDPDCKETGEPKINLQLSVSTTLRKL